MDPTNVLVVGTRAGDLERLIEPYIGVATPVALHSFTVLKEAQHCYNNNPGFFDAVVVEGTPGNVDWAQNLWAYGVKVIVLAPDYTCAELDYLPPKARNFTKRLLRMLA